MQTICTILVAAFAIAYVIALVLFVIGTYGLFGSPSGPLAGVFLVPLGIPWIFMLDGLSENLKPWLGILAPGLNLALLWLLCRTLRRFVT
jgi:hypothetical protein